MSDRTPVPPPRGVHGHDSAVAWAEGVVGQPFSCVEQLKGGLTSTMLRLTTERGERYVLRLMTNEPWRSHGPDLTRRERDAQEVLAGSGVPAPRSIGLDAEGTAARVPAHLMTHLPGAPRAALDPGQITAMAEMLAAIHEVSPEQPFRTYQSWAWEAKWVTPAWSRHPHSWERAFALLAGPAPAYAPTFLHRDFSHRNLLWDGARITGVVDWVETSTGPAWLDAGHAATTLAVESGPYAGAAFVRAYRDVTGRPVERHWLVMDAVGFLPAPGKQPLFGAPAQLERLDAWLHRLIQGDPSGDGPRRD